jgi:hypothetical protein
MTEDTAERVSASNGVTRIKHDNRGLSLRIYFYGDIAGKAPTPVVPKVFWEQGVIHLVQNDLHGIEASEGVPFNHATDLLWKINCLLRDNGIEVVKPRDVQTLRQLKEAGVKVQD